MAIDVEVLLGELAEQRKDRGGISTTTLNVVAFLEGDERLLQQLTNRTDQLAERYSARTVLLVASLQAQAHTVQARCNEVNDTLLTHSEQIQLGVSDVGAAELRSIVHALVVPNVRTVLLWGGKHVADPRFTALADIAHIVVLFSSATCSGADALRELLPLQGTPVAAKIRDLAYMRLLPWQDLVAQFFDDEELAGELPQISRVDITCGSEPEAYYLVGWLASRLSWSPCGHSEFCNPEGMRIDVGVSIEGPPRRVRSVCLRSAHSVFGATIEKDADDLVCLTVEGEKRRPQRCLPLHDLDIISLLERAIFSTVDDVVYGETVAMAGRYLEHTLPL
jgi:glucose-6-phosphate dehydrogenase assembly protein OpcA